jgi:hypothetical protein
MDKQEPIPTPDFVRRALAARKGDGGRALITYVPGLGRLGVEDYMTQASDNVSHPMTIYCCDAVEALFRTVNIGKRAWIDWCRSDKDSDPTKAKKGGNSFERNRAQSWRSRTWSAKRNKPAAISMQTMWDILENATYGGVPTITISVPKDRPIDFRKPFTVTGGFIGLHDFVNGSGYIDSIRSPIEIPAGTGDWIATEATGYGLDSVYGLVGSYYDARIAA